MTERNSQPRLTIDDESLAAFIEWIDEQDASLDARARALAEAEPGKLDSPKAKTKYLGEVAFVAGQKEQLVATTEALARAVTEQE